MVLPRFLFLLVVVVRLREPCAAALQKGERLAGQKEKQRITPGAKWGAG
jgi:hypothetical protein